MRSSLMFLAFAAFILGSVNSQDVQPGTPAGKSLCNAADSGFFPPAPSCHITASELGCPSENQVCAVVDKDWLECATQRDSLFVANRSQCSEKPIVFGFPMSTKSENFAIPITPRCYNVSTHVCTNGYQLCPIESPSLCGLQCYNEDQYKCWQAFTLCPSEAPMRCGDDCYSPTMYECNQGHLVQLGESEKPTNQTDA